MKPQRQPSKRHLSPSFEALLQERLNPHHHPSQAPVKPVNLALLAFLDATPPERLR